MNKEELEMLNHVKKALINKEVFIGLMGVAEDNSDFTVVSNTKDESLANSILAETLLNGTLRELKIESLFTPDLDDVNKFTDAIMKGIKDIAKKHLDMLSGSVNAANPINVMADEKNHRGMITLDISDVDNLQNDSFFKTMPESLQEEIIKIAKEENRNAK